MGDFDAHVASVRTGAASAQAAAADLIDQLTDEELLGLLDGDQGFWAGGLDTGRHGYNHEPIVAGAVPRLGIPGIRFTDGPRGVVMGRSTCFPVAMARGATWDPELEAEIGRAIGAEGRAQGANLFAGVCVNLLRHPAWGRAQETYGEDPHHVGAMGAALTRGVRHHLMACVKHFAVNSIESSRFVVDVTADERALHEVYLPHFRVVLDAGAESVMSAYNSLNGQWCGDSPALLTDVLRTEWGFDGFVMSDFVFGHRDPIGSVAAGLDLEMPYRQQRARTLPAALADGRLRRADVITAATRLLATQLRYVAGLADRAPDRSVVACGEHRRLARRAAAQSMVLLRNEPVGDAPVLPLDAGSLHTLAVIGKLATASNLGDSGSSVVRPPSVVTMLDGIRARFGAGAAVDHDDGAEPDRAASLAASVDLAVVVVGFGARDEGEAIVAPFGGAIDALPRPVGRTPIARLLDRLAAHAEERRVVPGGDRKRLSLRPHDERLIERVAAANPRTVVVVVAGSAVLMESWRHHPAAILLAWYPGMEGGHALADVLCGAAEPGGRLPFVVPTDSAHLPHFERVTQAITYDRWWGQRLLDRDGNAPAAPLGFGLGYTTFAVANSAIDRLDQSAERAVVSVDVTNTGGRAGSTVVQVYASRPDSDEPTRRELVGFCRVTLDAGASERVAIECSLRPLARRDPDSHTWTMPPGPVHIEVGQHCGDSAAALTTAILAP